MPPFWKSSRTPESHYKLLTDIKTELRACYPRSTTRECKDFIHPRDARRVFSRDRARELLSHYTWYKEDDRHKMWEKMNLILCILVLIDWQDWARFHDYFYEGAKGMKNERCSNENLPLTGDFAKFLPDPHKGYFLRDQYIFLPIFITEHSHDQVYNEHFRLPVLHVEALAPDSSQGKVEQVKIDGRFVTYAGGRINSDPQLFARKRITAKKKRDFRAETKALVEFNNCLVEHRNIMKSLASFVHGEEFVILTPWAEGGDLAQFLYAPEKTFREQYPERSRRFTPNNLMLEAFNLAQALRFLHFEMDTKMGRKLKCAHLDLKPDNILVCLPPGDDCPVGIWKITDFGMAQIEETVASVGVVPEEGISQPAPGDVLRDMSTKPPKRGAGTFQPPEVQTKDTAKVSTRRDVWSFGCILAMVLAFAVGGPDEVWKQFKYRNNTKHDFFYSRVPGARRRARGSRWSLPVPDRDEWEIQPDVRKWLEEESWSRHAAVHHTWIQNCAKLVISLLNVNILHRPEIHAAISGLGMITGHTAVHGSERMWEFGDVAYEPREVPEITPQLAVGADVDDTDTEIMGRMSNTPPSSAPSPNRGLSPSMSWTSAQKPDESVSFFKLDAPSNALQARISADATQAALHNSKEIFVYDLAAVKDDSGLWAEKPSRSSMLAEHQVKTAACTLRRNPSIVSVYVAGPYIGLLEHQESRWSLEIIERTDTGYIRTSRIALNREPDVVKLSSEGYCAIYQPNQMSLHMRHQPEPLCVDLGHMKFCGLEFTVNGKYLCLWERDRDQDRNQSSPSYHYWSVWDRNGRAVCDTIKHKVPTWRYQAASQRFLIPFHDIPRFVACDMQYYVYLITARSTIAEVVQLGRTVGVCAGLALPNDEAFILVRASQSGRQKVDRFDLTVHRNKIVWQQRHSPVRLHSDIDKDHHGYAVRECHNQEDVLILLSLDLRGNVIRKAF